MAASRIKGITVEIDGDTTGLSKALSSVNKEMKSTQVSAPVGPKPRSTGPRGPQLKDVEKLEEAAETASAEMYISGYKSKREADSSYGGLWNVSFSLKEF